MILWGESLPADALAALLRIADKLGLAGRDGAGLLEVPAGTNARGIREAGALPERRPRLLGGRGRPQRRRDRRRGCRPAR